MQLLQEYPWDEAYPKLVKFAEWLIQGKHWNGNVLPKGQTAESIVRDAIAKTFAEVRNWDPDRGDLFEWLNWVIKSDISHLARSASNRKDIHLDSMTAEGSDWDERGLANEHQSKLHLQTASPEEAIVAKETDEETAASAKLKIDALLEASSGRPELEEIVFAISEGNCSAKPQELAAFLGKPVEEINQSLRALRRRASKIRIEAANGTE
jgi:DNA-directed RNA polymerase specialized sigma24 family protein